MRLTRYRAHPPTTYAHVYISIEEDNFDVPQCQKVFQTIKLYEFAVSNPISFIRTEYHRDSFLYLLMNSNSEFTVDPRTGAVNYRNSFPIDSTLAVRVFDEQFQVHTDCFLRIQWIHRHQLIPKFISTLNYQLNLTELSATSFGLRQRLFQLVAILNEEFYENNLEIRYRIVQNLDNFMIHPRTGSIASKRPLKVHSIHRFQVS